MQRMERWKGGVTSFTKVDVTSQRKGSIEKPELLTRRSITYWQLLSNKREHLGGEIVNSISCKRPTLSHPASLLFKKKKKTELFYHEEEEFSRNGRLYIIFLSLSFGINNDLWNGKFLVQEYIFKLDKENNPISTINYNYFCHPIVSLSLVCKFKSLNKWLRFLYQFLFL